MATTIEKIVTSDLSGKKNASTITFGLEGTWYEIDLTDQEKDQLESALQKYVSKSQKSTTRRAGPAPKRTPEEREEFRAYLINKGYSVKKMGRIPQELDKEHYPAFLAEQANQKSVATDESLAVKTDEQATTKKSRTRKS